MKPLKGHITISRPQGNRTDGNVIRIALRDSASRMEFVQFEVPLAGFSEALTGLSEVEGEMTVRGLDKVGKTRIVEHVTFVLDGAYLERHKLSSYYKEEIRKHIELDPEGIFHQEGWELSTYLGAQNSVVPNHPNGIRINTSRVRYVERTEE